MSRLFLGLLLSALTAVAGAEDLYSNSGSTADPIGITHPGLGFNGGDVSALQVSLGMDLFGTGAQVLSANSVADNFIVPPSEAWTISEVELYAYQTNAAAPSINTCSYAFAPTDPNGQVPPAMTTVPVTSAWFGTNPTYRAADDNLAGAGSSSRRIQVMKVAISPAYVANEGSHWIAFQLGGTGASGPWVPPVVVLGQTGKPGANALQSLAAGAYSPLLDPGSSMTLNAPQDLPFILRGTKSAGGCKWDLNGDGKVCQEDLGILLSGFGTIYFQPELGELLSEFNGGCGNPCQ